MSEAAASVAVITVEQFLEQLPTKLQFASAGGQPSSVVVCTYRTIAGFPKEDWSDRVRPNLYGDTLTMRISGYSGTESEFDQLAPAAQETVFEDVYEIGPSNHERPMLVVAYGGNDHLHRVWSHLDHVRRLVAFSRALLVCKCATGWMALGTPWPWAKGGGPAWLIEGACHGDHSLGQIVQALGKHLQIPLVPEERS